MVKSSFQDKASENGENGENAPAGSFDEYWAYNKAIWDQEDGTRDCDRDYDHGYCSPS